MEDTGNWWPDYVPVREEEEEEDIYFKLTFL